MAGRYEKLEGSDYSKLVKLMRGIGYNRDVDVRLATITSVYPLRLSIDGDNFDMESEELILTERFYDAQKHVNDRVIVIVIDNKMHIALDKAVYA